jgi:disulfide bond formation protein DsbB
MNLTFRERRPSRTLFGWVGAAALLAVALAWVAQHRFNMQPCPWCVLQRILFLAVALVCVLVRLSPRRLRVGSNRVGALLVGALGLSGIAAALYQNLFAAKSASCVLTLADRIITGLGLDQLWPDMFEVRASCADAAVRVLGVPFEVWSLALFALFVWAAAKMVRRHG